MLWKQKGFTLIELLVVISIIGVLSTIAMTSLNGARAKARDARRRTEISEIHKALEIYFSVHGQYPTETWCDSSKGSCSANCPCTTADWTYSGSYIAKVLQDENYFQSMPIDPVNDNTYYYWYEPNCGTQGGCQNSCCSYQIGCRLESGGSYTINSANQP